MRKSVKRQWVRLLQDPFISQCHDCLSEDEGTYCAVGALCELYRREQGGRWEWDEALRRRRFRYGGEDDGEDKVIPVEVSEWACLSEEEEDLVVGLNDAYFDDLPTIGVYVQNNF